MAYQFKLNNNFITEFNESAKSDNSKKEIVKGETFKDKTSENKSDVTLGLATSTKIAFDVIFEIGIGQKNDTNPSLKRRSPWKGIEDPSKASTSNSQKGNLFNRIPEGSFNGTQVDSLEQLINSRRSTSQNVPLSGKRKAALESTSLQSPSVQGQGADREPRKTQEHSKRELHFIKNEPAVKLSMLAPPKQPDALDIALEAHPNPSQNRVIHPLNRRSNAQQ